MVKYGKTHGYQKGNHTLEINVEGEGPMAKIIKEIADFNYSSNLAANLTNEDCFYNPTRPDWIKSMFFVLLPMTIMLFFQVI